MNTLFEFKVPRYRKRPGIFFKWDGKEHLIEPTELYAALWDDMRRRDICQGIRVFFHIGEEYVDGFIEENYECEGLPKIQRHLFVDNAIKSLTQLSEHVINGERTIYRKFPKETAEQLLVGLKDLIPPVDGYRISEESIHIDDFSFHFDLPYIWNNHFMIKIGDRSFESTLYQWSKNFIVIRSDIERYIHYLRKEKELNIEFEHTPTYFRLQNRFCENNRIVTKVTIEPDKRTKKPIVWGWCEPRQLVRSLYLGILEYCFKEKDFSENKTDKHWEEYRLGTYNQLQSCVIEDFINGMDDADMVFHSRNRIVHNVEEMKEDYSRLQKSLRDDCKSSLDRKKNTML